MIFIPISRLLLYTFVLDIFCYFILSVSFGAFEIYCSAFFFLLALSWQSLGPRHNSKLFRHARRHCIMGGTHWSLAKQTNIMLLGNFTKSSLVLLYVLVMLNLVPGVLVSCFIWTGYVCFHIWCIGFLFHFGRLGLFTCSVYWLIVSFGQVRFVFVLLLMSLVCAVCFWFLDFFHLEIYLVGLIP